MAKTPIYGDPDGSGPIDYAIWRKVYDRDDNEWWRIGCGHHQNLYDIAYEQACELSAENIRLRDMVAELRGRLAMAERP